MKITDVTGKKNNGASQSDIQKIFKKIQVTLTALHSPVAPCLICIGCSRHISLQTASGNPSHNMECHLCNNDI
jgi:hypothetical protein